MYEITKCRTTTQTANWPNLAEAHNNEKSPGNVSKLMYRRCSFATVIHRPRARWRSTDRALALLRRRWPSPAAITASHPRE